MTSIKKSKTKLPKKIKTSKQLKLVKKTSSKKMQTKKESSKKVKPKKESSKKVKPKKESSKKAKPKKESSKKTKQKKESSKKAKSKIVIKIKKNKTPNKDTQNTQRALDYRSGVSDYNMRTKSRTIRAYIDKKYGSKDPRLETLKDLNWGFGIEHEVHFFHLPELPEYNPRRISSKFDKITNFIIYDGFHPSVDLRIQYPEKLTSLEFDFLDKIPYETSGRLCNHKWVLNNTLYNGMPEFITTDPFSNLRTGKRPVEAYCTEIQEKEKLYVRLQSKNPVTKKRIMRYGILATYPFGMSNFIAKPIYNKSEKYEFVKNKKGEIKNHTDYTGSYHVTMTLPFNASINKDVFINMHENFANHIQWIEPLLLTSFFSSDQRAVGTLEKRVRGSFRVMRVGWGNFGGSDVRKFNEGIGRYANIEPFWRKGLQFKDINKLKYCDLPKKKEPGAISALSSNFRTFGSTDPDRPEHRESGAPMTKPNGIEIRIFDHFDSSYLKHLCRLLVYIAAHSKHNKCDDVVYENKNWIDATQSIMKYGWKAILTKGYIDELRHQLNLPIKTKSMRAFDIMWQVNTELFERNKKEDISFLMLEKEYGTPPELPQINRQSWEMGFLVKLNMDDALLNNFNKLLYTLPDATLTFTDYKKHFYTLFPKDRWEENVEDIVFFFKYKGMMTVELTPKGQINKIKIVKSNIRHLNNTNNEIYNMWHKQTLDLISKVVIDRLA